MDVKTKAALASQRDEILRYVRENEGSRFARVDFDMLRQQAADLDDMIENGIEPAETAISYQDLIDAFFEKWRSKNAYNELNEPYKQTRYGISGTAQWIRDAERRGESEERIAEERKRLDEYRRHFDESYLSDEFTKALDDALVNERHDNNVWHTLRRLHVEQCAEIAMRALLEDLSWTKQPTRYKRMRSKAESIANKALLGTGCKLSAYENGELHINHDWCSFFTHVEHNDDVELPAHDYGNDMPNIERMRSTLERMERREGRRASLSFDYEQVKAVIGDIGNAIRTLKRMHDEYVEKAKEVIAPFEALGLSDEKCLGYHDSITGTAVVKDYEI